MINQSNCSSKIEKQHVSQNEMIYSQSHLNHVASPSKNNDNYLNTNIYPFNNRINLLKQKKNKDINQNPIFYVLIGNQNNKIDILNEKQIKKIKSHAKHKKFTETEDEMLKRVVHLLGAKNWKFIATLIPGRTPRQCRDRYWNYLAPLYIRTQWTEEEDKLLAEKFKIYGPKWSQIRLYLPYRTPNDIKNRYNYTVSKKMNSIRSKFNCTQNQNKINNEAIEDKKNENDKLFINEEGNEFFQEQFGLFNEESQMTEYDYLYDYYKF